jgi:lipoprotein-anchoring transpeptidase ErfK/SrfK
MIRRDPERYAKYAGSLQGGPENPLGRVASTVTKSEAGSGGSLGHSIMSVWWVGGIEITYRAKRSVCD